jgi:glycosyltransferase involved in cell wall biosynthesis
MLDYPAYEVLVIDNASRDERTREVVAATPFRYIYEPRVGLNQARNRGACEAAYDLLAYTDDDVVVSPGWLRGIAAAFAQPDVAEVAVVTGLVVPLEMETRAQWLFEQYGGMGKGTQPRSFQRHTLPPLNLIAAHNVGVGANMALSRPALQQLGLFDVTIGVGTPAQGAGDLDIFHRAMVAGFALRYAPAAMVRHQHRRDLDALRRQLYQNGRAFGVYLLKIWVRRSVPRRHVIRFAAGWFSGWLLARLIACTLGRLRFPLALVLAELEGAMHAPWAWYHVCRRAARSEREALPF